MHRNIYLILSFLVFFTGTSCGLRPPAPAPAPVANTSTSPASDSTTTNPTTTTTSPTNVGQAGPKCSDITDTSVVANCENAQGSSGQLLGCKVNQYTEKCVEDLWKHVVKSGECEEITKTGDCSLEGVKIAEAEAAGTALKTIGLCRIKAGTNKCEQAPVGSAIVTHKYCIPHRDKDTLKQIADDLCIKYYDHTGRTTAGLTRLAGSCDIVFLPRGFSTGPAPSGICLSESDSSKCKGYLSHTDIQNILNKRSYADPIKNFCDGLIKKEKKARPDFSELYDEKDDSACGKTAIYTEAHASTKQVAYTSDRKDVCTKSSTP